MKRKKESGQGAVEYLLILAAGIIVAATVISFLIGTIPPVEETGCEGLKNMLCDSLDSNTAFCACQNGNESYFGGIDAGKTYCCKQKCPTLKSHWLCGE
ncbi:MAG: hypothetical protein WC308_00040 [archaeon]